VDGIRRFFSGYRAAVLLRTTDVTGTPTWSAAEMCMPETRQDGRSAAQADRPWTTAFASPPRSGRTVGSGVVTKILE